MSLEANNGAALVVCVGNSLAADDAVGIAVYEKLLQERLPPSARLICKETAGLAVLDTLDGEGLLVVVDSVRFGSEAGDVVTLEWDEIPRAGGRTVSVHGIGIVEAVEMTTHLFPERAPMRTVLVGVEAETFEPLGARLSPSVARAVPRAADRVVELVTEHLRAGTSAAARRGEEVASS